MSGVSRSVILVLYYLMQYQNMTLKDSYEYLSSRREQYTIPNRGFSDNYAVWKKIYMVLIHYQ